MRARAFKEHWKPTRVDTHTYLFLADVIHQAPDWPATRVPPPHFPAGWGGNTVDYGMDPAIVGEMVIDGIRENHMHIVTHAEYRGIVEQRMQRLLAAFDRAATRNAAYVPGSDVAQD